MSDIADDAQREIEAMQQRIQANARIDISKQIDSHLAVTECTNCREQISAARKSAYPHATRCTACQIEIEIIRKGR